METVRISELTIDTELEELRKTDTHMVSRYRQAVRQGAKFPPLIVDNNNTVIDGKMRLQAYLAELDPSSEISVKRHNIESRADKLRCMVEANVKHGLPIDSFSRKKIIQALLQEKIKQTEIAKLFGVDKDKVEMLAGQYVVVLGDNKSYERKAIKAGPDITLGSRVARKKYDTHATCDYGVPARRMADQLVRWLNNGWIDLKDEKNKEALVTLRVTIEANEIV